MGNHHVRFWSGSGDALAYRNNGCPVASYFSGAHHVSAELLLRRATHVIVDRKQHRVKLR